MTVIDLKLKETTWLYRCIFCGKHFSWYDRCNCTFLHDASSLIYCGFRAHPDFDYKIGMR